MRVVLFTSAMLAAASDALQLSQMGANQQDSITPEGMPLVLAQTQQIPDVGELKNKAAKAMDKDDKKKMGDEKFNQYRRIRKVLQQKNGESKKLAQKIEDVLDGKKSNSNEGSDGKKSRSGSRSGSKGKNNKSSSSKGTKGDTKDKVKSAVNSIKGRMEDKNKRTKEEQKKKLEEVVKTLRERMSTMKETMEEKSKVDVRSAVAESQVAQKKVNQKIYSAMNKQVPAKMRSVIKTAITSFRDGRVGKGDVESLLNKHFSDKMLDGIFKCVQGDLEKCKRIDLDSWKLAANRDVEALAEKARIREFKRKQKEKNVELKRVDAIITEKSMATQHERKEERHIQKKANKLT